MEAVICNGREYTVEKLLGHGKGGYSYLVSCEGAQYVLKKIHHEPCSYYQFGNKLEAEKRDYQTLRRIGILMPEMLWVDEQREWILKEYIDGPTVWELVLSDRMCPAYVEQVKQMCARLYPAGLNIDYFPTNFVLQNGTLYYIDYECNAYMKEWDFEHWGVEYWSKTQRFLEYVHSHGQQ